MRSRAARLSLSATAWIAMIAAALVFVSTDNRIAARRDALDAFELRTRGAVEALANARSGLQAYVAAGQDSALWIPRVATSIRETSEHVDALRATATTVDAAQALLDASSALTEVANIDKRAREYLRTGEALMAGDVVFSEGQETAARTSALIETARVSEAQSSAADEARWREWKSFALAAAAGWAILVLAILTLAPARPVRQEPVDASASSVADGESDLQLRPGEPMAVVEPPRAISRSAAAHVPGPTATLAGVAELCTELSQVRDASDLQAFLGRAASRLDASGVVVWVGSSTGSDLQPVAAHGYAERVLAMMKPIPRAADNATAAAYRDSTLHVVPAGPGAAPGAVVAPLLSIDGCIGAFTAEIRDGGETSPAVQAVATIVAAQLSSVLTPASSASAAEARASA